MPSIKTSLSLFPPPRPQRGKREELQQFMKMTTMIMLSAKEEGHFSPGEGCHVPEISELGNVKICLFFPPALAFYILLYFTLFLTEPGLEIGRKEGRASNILTARCQVPPSCSCFLLLQKDDFLKLPFFFLLLLMERFPTFLFSKMEASTVWHPVFC